MGIEVKNPFGNPDLRGTIRVLHHHKVNRAYPACRLPRFLA
jgi:hypothetical protein